MALDQLSLLIEEEALKHNSYIDAIVEYSKENSIDFEDILEVVNSNIYNKVRAEFINKNFIPELKNEVNLMSFMKD